MADGLIFVPAFEPALPAVAAPQRRGHVAIVHHSGGEDWPRRWRPRTGRAGDKAATVRWGAPIGAAQTIYLLPDDGSGDAEAITVAAFRVLRELAKTRGRQPLRVKIVTVGAADAGPRPVRPDSAGVIGLARSAAAECPGWTVSCLDVAAEPARPRRASRPSWPAILAPSASSLTVTASAWSGRSGRWRTRVRLRTAARTASGGVYLIVGGSGGIGGLLARHLARTERASVVLTGRRWPPTARSMRCSRTSGGSAGGARYLRADVADESAMRSAVRHAKSRVRRAARSVPRRAGAARPQPGADGRGAADRRAAP